LIVLFPPAVRGGDIGATHRVILLNCSAIRFEMLFKRFVVVGIVAACVVVYLKDKADGETKALPGDE